MAETNTSTVQLNFPQAIELKSFVDYVSQRLGIRILFDQSLEGKPINIRAPKAIPTESLLGVLESALQMSGMAIVDADTPGWKRIIPSNRIAAFAKSGSAADAIKQSGDNTPVTQAFVLQYANPEEVDQLVKSFLSEGANSIPFPESRTLIVTDYAVNVLRIAKWIETIDRPRNNAVLEFVRIRHLEAEKLATQLNEMASAKNRAERRQENGIEITHDPRTNQIVLIGSQNDVAGVQKWVRMLDVPLQVLTRTYRFRNVSAERIDRLVKQLIDPIRAKTHYKSAIDADDNLLIATTTIEIHQQIESLRESRDVEGNKAAQSPVRFYKVRNLPVNELLATIRAIETGDKSAGLGSLGGRSLWNNGRIRPARQTFGSNQIVVPGPNNLPVAAGDTQLLPPPSYQDNSQGIAQGAPPNPVASPAGHVSTADPLSGAADPITEMLGRARVTADIHTNTLIVIAEPAVQRIYAQLIEKLDQRRPQVLIEAQFVVIDTSNDFSLGVELSGGDGEGSRRNLAFSSFGLSQVNPVTGALSLLPGLGFNGTIVDADIADVVLRAVTSHRRSRVLAAPRLVVNDNATGQLSSVSEVPFTSVNASQTVATTSFAGFAEAGTTITVTPRISEDNYLQLDFTITQNTFTGSGAEGVPPPRQTDEVTSQVTIPDGNTVIVGGLRRRNAAESETGIPLIERIPVIRHLGGRESSSDSQSSLFVFLKPIILRDDKFKELKYLSDVDTCRARTKSDYPSSEPALIR
ncbi:MAG: hypothetical protein KDB27_14015 [Planctomycetales bacterium]|nr:hypothetical protein [Planctomycetales bacterium]